MTNTVTPSADIKASRIDWIDFAKAIGILLIVFGHAIKGTVAHSLVYSFHVPLFFFLTGATFGCRTSYPKFLLKRVKTLLVPYAITMAISLVIFYFLGSFTADSLDVATHSFSWKDYILGSLYGNYNTGFLKANSPLWFLPCLFVVQNLMYGIVKLVEKSKKTVVGIAFAIVLSIGLCYLNFYVMKIDMLPFGAETAVYMLPFALLGYAFVKLNSLKIKRIFSCLIGVILFGIAFAIVYFFSIVTNVSSNQYSDFTLCYVTALIGTLAIVTLCKAISPAKPISYIGQNTMPVLLLHKFPILFFQVLFKPTVAPLADNNIPVAIIVAIISLGMCIAVGEILKRIFPIMIGASFKRKSKTVIE